jgi:predicted nucleic-acid-binding Zn-ribbon protein
MITHTCFKCGRRYELDPVLVGIELSKLKVKKPKFYKAHCPGCQSSNKISIPQMQADLDAVADEIVVGVAEMEKARAEAKAAKRAAIEAKQKV